MALQNENGMPTGLQTNRRLVWFWTMSER